MASRSLSAARAYHCLSVVLLQAFFFLELHPGEKLACAQEAKGIHCAVGTGSCGNWLELGGYKTSCKCFESQPSISADHVRSSVHVCMCAVCLDVAQAE